MIELNDKEVEALLRLEMNVTRSKDRCFLLGCCIYSEYGECQLFNSEQPSEDTRVQPCIDLFKETHIEFRKKFEG